MFQKRHYEAIAAIIAALPCQCPALAAACVREFRRDNPRFDVDRFLDACGLTRRIIEEVCK
jgi:hypothetical protein